ncbi:MAG: nuclear transport factor 2 family protein [Candidatus Dormibacteraeota bacterium]|nr:nuclear transport factor 2 family protein [Candidatus Dormibacteraeota bacterium]
MGTPRELLDGFSAAIASSSADLAAVCTPDVEFRDSMAEVSGIAAVGEYLKAWWTAFPDATVSIDDIVTSGDQAVGRMLYRGTQTGPLVGPAGEIPATGKPVELRGAGWITIRDGKIARFDGYYDTMTMMVQLGVVPMPANV